MVWFLCTSCSGFRSRSSFWFPEALQKEARRWLKVAAHHGEEQEHFPLASRSGWGAPGSPPAYLGCFSGAWGPLCFCLEAGREGRALQVRPQVCERSAHCACWGTPSSVPDGGQAAAVSSLPAWQVSTKPGARRPRHPGTDSMARGAAAPREAAEPGHAEPRGEDMAVRAACFVPDLPPRHLRAVEAQQKRFATFMYS